MFSVVNETPSQCPTGSRVSACASSTQLSIKEYASYAAEHAAFDEVPLIVRTPKNVFSEMRDKNDALLAGEIPLSLPENASLGLRVGAERSGTVVRNSSSVEALVLLSGCLLWLFMPPGAQVDATPSSVFAFFAANARKPEAIVVVQEPGETIVIQRGWTFATFKIETSTSLSISF